MLDFIGTNWIWILLIGGMFFMHLGHGDHGVLRPEIVAITMAGSSALGATNARTPQWLKLPHPTAADPAAATHSEPSGGPASGSAGVSAAAERP